MLRKLMVQTVTVYACLPINYGKRHCDMPYVTACIYTCHAGNAVFKKKTKMNSDGVCKEKLAEFYSTMMVLLFSACFFPLSVTV
jgi:hypothetical protein